MIPLNRIEQLNNFTDDLQRDTALSNLRAMQALQQGIPSLMMGMEPMQTPMLNMNEGGVVFLKDLLVVVIWETCLKLWLLCQHLV